MATIVLVLHGQIVVDNSSRSSELWSALPLLGVGVDMDAPGVPQVLAERDLVKDTIAFKLGHPLPEEDDSAGARPEIVSSLRRSTC